jgi:hypothetical protein
VLGRDDHAVMAALLLELVVVGVVVLVVGGMAQDRRGLDK